MNLIHELIKGVLIAILYFETTKLNDTTVHNTMFFAGLYLIIIIAANMIGVDISIVTNAFVTKTIFTLVDERITKPDEDKNSKTAQSTQT
jgi:hypothetical protein